MNIVPFLSSLWPGAGRVLLSVWGAEITPTGILLVALGLLVGGLLGGGAARIAVRVSRIRGLHSERLLRLIHRLSVGGVLLLGLGLGLELGGIVGVDVFARGVFGLFTTSLFRLGDHDITLTTFLTIGAILLATSSLSRLLRAAVGSAIRLRIGYEDEGTLQTVDRLLYYAVLALGLVVALQTAGVDLSAILATGAAFAVGLSLALQSVAQNFISGLILLLERAIKPGDILSLDGRMVRVVRIGVRSTTVQDLCGVDTIVPNAELVSSAVDSLTHGDRQIWIHVGLAVPYGSDYSLVLALMAEAGRAIPQAPPEVAPFVAMAGFEPSFVKFSIYQPIVDPWGQYGAASDLRMAIVSRFERAGITLATPRLEVRLGDTPPLQSLAS